LSVEVGEIVSRDGFVFADLKHLHKMIVALLRISQSAK
jgi:hypothetical protein